MMKLAGCVIVDSNQRILLLHRQTPPIIQWELPGGKVEKGEDPKAAAIREVKEELGVEVEITEQLGSASFKQENNSYEYHWFSARQIHPIEQPSIHEPHLYDKLQYYSLTEIEKLEPKSNNLQNLLVTLKANRISQ